MALSPTKISGLLVHHLHPQDYSHVESDIRAASVCVCRRCGGLGQG